MKNLAFSHLKVRIVGIALLGLIMLLILAACGETSSPTSVPQAAATATPALATTAVPTTPDTKPRVTTAAITAVATARVTTTAPIAPITTARSTIATSPIPGNASRAAQEDDIREMIFRYTFQHSFGGNVPKLYFLSLASTMYISKEQKDPGDALLKRFQGENFTVKRISEATISNATPYAVKDKTTGENGLIYGVSEIKWLSDTEVEIEGSYYMFGMNAGGTTYKVGLENGKWTIKDTGRVWIT